MKPARPVQRLLNFSLSRPLSSTRPLTLQRPTSAAAPVSQAPPEPPYLGPDDQGRTPFDFQQKGIQWLYSRTRGLLADEMGLGKSVQFLRAIPRIMPAIMVCPASLRLVWQDECFAWRPDITPIVCGPGDFQIPEAGELSIVSYESLPDPPPRARRWLIPDPRVNRCVLGVDEAHYCKNYRVSRTGDNRGAQRAFKVALLARQCARVWPLTGTPMLGKPKDLWGTLAAFGLAQEVFGDYYTFCELFGATRKRFGKGPTAKSFWEFPSETSEMPGLEQVKERLGRVALRRLRKDVAPNLPPKLYQTIPVEAPEELKAQLDYVGSMWVDQSELPPFEMLSAVRAELARARIPAVLETVERFESEGVPLLVFSVHREPVQALGGRAGWAVITGDTSPELRRFHVDAFQSGLLSGLAITIAAGGVGITLTRAAHVLFVDRAYTPSENAQAEDRAVRIGQEASSVQILTMVADHPVDRLVNEILLRKQRLISATTGGTLG